MAGESLVEISTKKGIGYIRERRARDQQRWQLPQA